MLSGSFMNRHDNRLIFVVLGEAIYYKVNRRFTVSPALQYSTVEYMLLTHQLTIFLIILIWNRVIFSLHDLRKEESRIEFMF